MGKLSDLHYELLERPLYSPDLAPSDFISSQNSNSSLLVSSFFPQSKDNCSCIGVFCRSFEEPLQGWDNGAEALLE
jgi:hypothetical protein